MAVLKNLGSLLYNSNADNSAALYPNPHDGRFTVRFEKALKNADIVITDVNGKKVNRFKANGTIVHADISRNPAGTYFLIIFPI